MKEIIFTRKEERVIKDYMKDLARMKKMEFDIEHAYKRFEFVLSQMRKDIRNRYFNNVEYTVEKRSPNIDVLEQYAYFAVKMEEWLSANFIVNVTKHGNIVFVSQFPSKDGKYIFTSNSDKVWSRDELEKAMAEAEDAQERE